MKLKKNIIIISSVIAIIILIILAVWKATDEKQKEEQQTNIEEIEENSQVMDEDANSLIGEGSEGNPYLIQSIEDLVLISKGVNDGTIGKGKIYSLETDLDFKSKNSYVNSEAINFAELGDINQNGKNETLYEELTTGTGFISIGNSMNTAFSGKIEGNGHTISNLYSKNIKGYTGLIGIVQPTDINEEIKISNITIKNAKVEGSSTGALIGYCYQSKNIILDSCNIIEGNITGGSGAGALIGEAYDSNLKAIKCKNAAKIKAVIAGGIIGIAPTKIDIEKCYNEGEISGEFYAGGIVGDGYSSEVIIKECYNSGTITGNVSAGIVCGKNVTIDDSFNIGKIEGTNLGAIVSNSDAENVSVNINNCFYLRGTCGRGIKGIDDIAGKVEALEENEINKYRWN